MATPRAESYAAASGATAYLGMSEPLDSLVPSGTIKSISKNTRADVDPQFDALANPNYPNQAPWDETGNMFTHISDYAGAILASDVGAAGTLMQWCAAGHSAAQVTMWAGFDVATRMWKRIGKRPLPSQGLIGYVANSVPSPSQFDHAWGEFIGGSTDWPAGFRQPGYNPPAGAHTRGSMTYRPASKAGNSSGQVLMGIDTTGKYSELAGNNLKVDHYYNPDDGLFYRMANDRPGYGATGGNKVYHEATDKVLGWNYQSSGYATEVHVLDCPTMTWSKISSLTNAPYLEYDAGQAFISGGLLVVCDQRHGSAAFTLYAIPIAGLLSGATKAWTSLTINGTAWPSKAGETISIQWQLCPLNGIFYAVDRVTGSKTLYKLTPPGTTDAVNLAGAWNLSSEALTGEGLVATDWHYNRLQWAPALKSFIFVGESVTGPVQALRPVGV